MIYFRMCVWMMTGRLGTLISQAVHQQASFSGTSEACDDSRSCLLVAFTSPFKVSHTLSRYYFGRIKNGGLLLPHLPMSSFLIEPWEPEDPCSGIQTAPSLVMSKEHITIWDWWFSSKVGTEPAEATGSLCLPKSTTESSVSWSKPFTGTEPPGKEQLNTASFLDLPPQSLCGFRALLQKAGTWMTKVFTFNLIWLSSIAISSCLCFCGPPALHSCSSQTLLPRKKLDNYLWEFISQQEYSLLTSPQYFITKMHSCWRTIQISVQPTVMFNSSSLQEFHECNVFQIYLPSLFPPVIPAWNHKLRHTCI